METKTRANRRGFTLVELLVVIAIIGILAAVLTPALYNAVLRARITRISLELSELDKAVEQYKNDKQDYPPDFSSINVLADLQDAGNVVVRHLRKAFPRHKENLVAVFTDSNGNLSVPDHSEALVFWLSRLKNDPRLPLSGSGEPDVGFDFDKGRLVDPDNDGWYSYVPRDATGAPYLYFESRTYDSTSYSFSGASVTETVRPYVYQPEGSTGTANIDWARPGKFQIISAGLDNEFGDWQTMANPGQPVNPPPASTYKLFPWGAENLNVVVNGVTVNFYKYGEGDFDNISNFSDKGEFEDHMP